MVRNRRVFLIAQSFYSPFLIKLLILGRIRDCGCHGNCGWDNCSSCSAATAAAATVAVATEATAAVATLAAVMVAAACSNGNYFCPAAATTPMHCSSMQDTTKRIVSFWYDLIFLQCFSLTIFLQLTVIWKRDTRLNAKPNQLSPFVKAPCWKEQHKGLV